MSKAEKDFFHALEMEKKKKQKEIAEKEADDAIIDEKQDERKVN